MKTRKRWVKNKNKKMGSKVLKQEQRGVKDKNKKKGVKNENKNKGE